MILLKYENKDVANNFYVRIIKQDMTNCENKDLWIYPSRRLRENKVTQIISVVQYKSLWIRHISNSFYRDYSGLLEQCKNLSYLHDLVNMIREFCKIHTEYSLKVWHLMRFLRKVWENLNFVPRNYPCIYVNQLVHRNHETTLIQLNFFAYMHKRIQVTFWNF